MELQKIAKGKEKKELDAAVAVIELQNTRKEKREKGN